MRLQAMENVLGKAAPELLQEYKVEVDRLIAKVGKPSPIKYHELMRKAGKGVLPKDF